MLKTLQYILMYILACTLTRQEEDDNVEVSFESRWYDCTQDAEACMWHFCSFFPLLVCFRGNGTCLHWSDLPTKQTLTCPLTSWTIMQHL